MRQHGPDVSAMHASRDLTRRRFFHRAGTLAASGLAAIASLHGSQVVEARARPQQPRTGRRPQRVAVVGANHYHASSTANYLRILQSEHVDIVGVHAPETAIAAKWAAEYGSTPYTDYRMMIEKTKPEFVI